MLVRGNSLVPVFGTTHGLDRVFDNLFQDLPVACGPPEGAQIPAIDAWEDEKSFHVEANLPGLNEKDLEISVKENELRIAGGSEVEKTENDAKYHRRERHSGRFSRVLRFPVDIDGDHAEAKYENGVLRITLPKAAASLPRRIEVKS